ncbi:folylpolyglutamate synthase, mitochondrial-like isoform X2 [Babylonia areolata]|uniref:folylpolyglutamate synthase, mitochondrial-like isoform X2 n=1 Tax=Babylonia areolata TaxID=304850 RepID=UPI003FD3568A
MAARGCVHSACTFPRALCGATDKLTTIFSVPYRPIQQIRRRACRLLTVPMLSRVETDSTARSMATSITSTKREPANLATQQPRQKSSYEEAVVALNSLQSNAETIRRSLQHRNESRKHNIPNMINYLQRVGISLDDVDKLSVIHVTGTKGKGSTCAFTESILRQYGYKTGIFSSPHLIEVRERIRINGRPIDRDLFSRSFWDVFNQLQASKDEHESGMPPYFSFLTVMALYVFVREGVDVAVLEVGIGGQYDSTNLVRSPVVCGVTSLDLDHTNLLGNTLQDIAWHKAGIFKKGAPAITVTQPDSAMQVILNRSLEIESPLSIAAPLTLEELSPCGGKQLGLAGEKQLYNAGLAVHLCRVWLHTHLTEQGGKVPRESSAVEEESITAVTKATSLATIPVRQGASLSQQMITGLCECRWPGRNQTIHTPGVTYYLDGAHTADSFQQCVDWFQRSADKERKVFKGRVWRALIFNMTGDRPVSCLLRKLKDCQFDMAAFCPNVVSTIASQNIPDQLNLMVEQETVLKKSLKYRQAWDDLCAQLGSEPTSAGADCNGRLTPSPPPPPPLHRHVNNNNNNNDDGSVDSHLVNGQYQNGVVGLDGWSPTQRCVSACFPCIASALQWVAGREGVDLADPTPTGGKGEGDHMQVLVTGSLHLVGGVLELLVPDMND